LFLLDRSQPGLDARDDGFDPLALDEPSEVIEVTVSFEATTEDPLHLEQHLSRARGAAVLWGRHADPPPCRGRLAWDASWQPEVPLRVNESRGPREVDALAIGVRDHRISMPGVDGSASSRAPRSEAAEPVLRVETSDCRSGLRSLHGAEVWPEQRDRGLALLGTPGSPYPHAFPARPLDLSNTEHRVLEAQEDLRWFGSTRLRDRDAEAQIPGALLVDDRTAFAVEEPGSPREVQRVDSR
jgi:hypothetical protein